MKAATMKAPALPDPVQPVRACSLNIRRHLEVVAFGVSVVETLLDAGRVDDALHYVRKSEMELAAVKLELIKRSS